MVESGSRVIFFAGKGGVGKTSVAAATGIRSASAGLKTIILSLDVAHSLSDIFDLEKPILDQNKGRPLEVHENLWIQELDIQEEIARNWGDIHKYLSLLLSTSGLDDILAEELAVLPGMEEVSLLLYINRYVKAREFDVILLDCAPTGESLRFISIPTTLEWYIKKIFKMERAIVKYARPLARRVYDVPLPGDDYFQAIERLFKRLQGVDSILTDPKTTSVRLVTNPEKIVLQETRRAFMYFSLYQMHIDAIIMNRLLPSGLQNGFFEEWKASQGKYLKEAEYYFSPVPILPAGLCRSEILGRDRLSGLAKEIYGDRNPLDFFFEGKPYELSKQSGQYLLRLKLPFLMKEDVHLNKVSDELMVRVGSFKSHIMLPRQVAASETVKARLDGEHLNIFFKGGGNVEEKDC
jgi:arsenite-transporting ATPase